MDCEKCMQATTLQDRQLLGCGLAPRPPEHLRPHVNVWSPLAYSQYNEHAPTVCPGYTTKLPEVRETARIRFHWEQGAIAQACGGAAPTDQTLLGIEVLSIAVSDLQDWRFKPAKEGGGGS